MKYVFCVPGNFIVCLYTENIWFHTLTLTYYFINKPFLQHIFQAVTPRTISVGTTSFLSENLPVEILLASFVNFIVAWSRIVSNKVLFSLVQKEINGNEWPLFAADFRKFLPPYVIHILNSKTTLKYLLGRWILILRFVFVTQVSIIAW